MCAGVWDRVNLRLIDKAELRNAIRGEVEAIVLCSAAAMSTDTIFKGRRTATLSTTTTILAMVGVEAVWWTGLGRCVSR